jgi:U3 small nucleolar RNA-associated protein 18
VALWDVGARRCVHRFADEGALHGTALAVSADGSHLACGFVVAHAGCLQRAFADWGASSRSDGGVVNLYTMAGALASARPQPARAFMNVTTPISLLRFNGDGQALALGSRQQRDALRLVRRAARAPRPVLIVLRVLTVGGGGTQAHVASRTVFSNWPTSQTPLHHVTAVDFSPRGGYLAVGNARGRVLLYRLNHYEAA